MYRRSFYVTNHEQEFVDWVKLTTVAFEVDTLLLKTAPFVEIRSHPKHNRKIGQRPQLFEARVPAMVSAIPPAINTALMIGETRSLRLVCTPIFASPIFTPCVSLCGIV